MKFKSNVVLMVFLSFSFLSPQIEIKMGTIKNETPDDYVVVFKESSKECVVVSPGPVKNLWDEPELLEKKESIGRRLNKKLYLYNCWGDYVGRLVIVAYKGDRRYHACGKELVVFFEREMGDKKNIETVVRRRLHSDHFLSQLFSFTINIKLTPENRKLKVEGRIERQRL